MASGLAVGLAQGVLVKLGEIVAEKALNEASLLLSFEKDFQWLQNKFSLLSGCLQYADNQSKHNAPVKQWLENVRDIAFDAQDIIDECAVDHLYRNNSQLCLGNCSQLIFNRKMGKRIRELKDRVTSIIQDGVDLKLFHDLSRLDQPSTSGTTSERGAQFKRGSAILEEDPRAVGLEEKVEEIVGLLEQPAVGVVAVVGMGGLGKTFLMQHVFEKIKQRYDHSAWISVSQSCSLRALQCDLARQINLPIDSTISDVLVGDLINGHLEGKLCLVVLDDVWDSSVEGDIKQRLGLPTRRKDQCKIVVTTRSRDVAEKYIKADHIYEMKRFSEEESWRLFCLFAFPNSLENKPPQHLKRFIPHIVEKCGGIPLAIKTLAASMPCSHSVGEWESKLKELKDVRLGTQDSTMQILKLSYNSLPAHLKCCFAYFSFFPEDVTLSFIVRGPMPENMSHDYLIYLWIAEGFIPQENDKDQLDIGFNYLHQLVNLCLVEVSQIIACYTVHDLLRDLAINISKENNCEFHLRPLQDTSSCRRLVLPKNGISNDAVSESALHHQQLLRTFSLFDNPEISNIPEHLFDRLRLLRALDFSYTAISALPKSVGRLKLLKLLNLSHTKITEVPKCVRRLKSLLFLDVSRCTSLQLLPNWIGELSSLSHLNARDCSKELGSHMPKGISLLVCLRTLRSDWIPLFPEENELLNAKDVGNLTNLQEINFSLEDVGGFQSVEDGILEGLTKMRILAVNNNIPLTERDILPAFPEKMNAMKDLQYLRFRRFSAPSWICGMPNLTTLELQECSDYPSLQNMPNLQTLVLIGDSRCRELPKNFGERGGFPKLVRLGIYNFAVLEELPALEDGAMQSLGYLGIGECPLVKKVGEGMERLRRLKRLRVEKGSKELEERLKEGGEDFNKIKANIPHIEIMFIRCEKIFILL